MTTTPAIPPRMTLIQLKRATRLPPPAERRAIRERAKVSRREIAEELGVSEAAVAWWENPGGFTPRPAVALAYRRLLGQLRGLATEDKKAQT
jgi:DNA-binding XRE family transcriptional regulator